jgi:hypothetical protein
MFKTVTASRFNKRMGNGRTKPCLVECEDTNGDSFELVVKCSAGCMQNEENLVLEAIAAMLAADLGLPVPEPFLVEIDAEFIALIPDDQTEIRKNFQDSCKYAFGSRFLPQGFAVWPTGEQVPEHLTNEAAEIFVFDAIIVNSDRRPENPNCLWSGKEVAIFDHELTFAQKQVLFWKAPWEIGGFDQMDSKERHIFARPYFKKLPDDLQRFVAAWEGLPQNRFVQYGNALPAEWVGDGVRLSEVIKYLEEARTNIQIIVDNALKVFK